MDHDQLPNLIDYSRQSEYSNNRVCKKVLEAISGLIKISKLEGLDVYQVTELFVVLPVKDDGGVTNLEMVNQCILTAQELIAKSYPTLSQAERLVREYRLVGVLFQLKAEQLKDCF